MKSILTHFSTALKIVFKISYALLSYKTLRSQKQGDLDTPPPIPHSVAPILLKRTTQSNLTYIKNKCCFKNVK